MAFHLPRPRFSWKPTISGREQWRWGLWMVVPSKSGRRSKLRIMVRGLLLWLGALAIAAYLALASAWFMVLEKRPYNLVTWTDCVLAPLRWDEISRKRGDSYISEGLAAMDAMNWSEAVVRIQAGLARSPDHRGGRERLAMFYVATGQRERGIKLMIEGINRAYPGRETVELLTRICVAGEDYNAAVEGLDASLAQQGPAVDRDRFWLIEQRARVLMISERFEQVLSWIHRQESLSEMLHEAKVVALIELERFEDAKQALQVWEQSQVNSKGGTLRIGVRLAREQNDVEGMEALLATMRDRSPTDPNTWVYSVVQEYLAGEKSAAAQRLDIVFMRFETREGMLLRLARPLVEIKAWDLFDVVDQRARLLGRTTDAWQQLRFEAAVQRGQYDEAVSLIEQMKPVEGDDRSAADQNFWRALNLAFASHLASGEPGPGEEMLNTLRRAPVPLPLLKAIAKRLESAGRVPTALNVWQLARSRYPGSQETSREVSRVGALVDATERVEIAVPLVQDGTPVDFEQVGLVSTEPASGNTALLGSARLFLARCDTLIGEGDWVGLETLLRDLRRGRPTWVTANVTELLNREIELNIGLRNWPGLLSNVRSRLDGTLPRALEIMNLVRRLDLMGERNAAELVIAEVDRRHTDFAPARRQREDWAKVDAATQEAAEKTATATP